MAEPTFHDFLTTSRQNFLRAEQIAQWTRINRMAGELALIQSQVSWLLTTRSAGTPPSSGGPPTTPGAGSLPARLSDLMQTAGEWGRRISLAISIVKAGMWIWGILTPALLLAATQAWKWVAPWFWHFVRG